MLALTATVLVVQVVGAVLSGSLAPSADSAHAGTDAAGLVIALVAATWLLGLPPTAAPGGTAGLRCWVPRCRPRCCWRDRAGYIVIEAIAGCSHRRKARHRG